MKLLNRVAGLGSGPSKLFVGLRLDFVGLRLDFQA